MKIFLFLNLLFFFCSQAQTYEKKLQLSDENIFFEIGTIGFKYAKKMSGIIDLENASLYEIEMKWQEFVEGKIKIEFTDEDLYDQHGQPMSALSYPTQYLTRIHRPSWNSINPSVRLRLRLIFHEVLRHLEVQNPIYNDEQYRLSQRMTTVTHGPVTKAIEQKMMPQKGKEDIDGPHF
jgi:hypothetical protein